MRETCCCRVNCCSTPASSIWSRPRPSAAHHRKPRRGDPAVPPRPHCRVLADGSPAQRGFGNVEPDAVPGLGASAADGGVCSPPRWSTNYSQEEIDVFYDATSKLMLRGGYRYVWGDASDAVLPAAGLVSSDQAKLRRNVGIGGVTFRPSQKISLSGRGRSRHRAAAPTSGPVCTITRKSARRRAIRPSTSLSLSADFTLLNNQNPVPGVNYDYRAQQESLSLFWSPGRRQDLEMFRAPTRDPRCIRTSAIWIRRPCTPQPSIYRDNAHTATALFNVNLPQCRRTRAEVTAGGSFFISSGSRPTSYYQPLVNALAADPQEAQLVHGMDVLRIRGSLLSV